MNCHKPLPFALRSLLRIAVLLALCSLPFAAHAQSATATLSGTVEDQNKAVVPGARVKAINLGTGLERETTTNESGDFTIPLLPPSTYTVRVERDGFATVEISSVVLNVGDQKALKIQLKAGNISEMVQITTEASLISESPAVSTVIDRTFVENLPLNGRGFNALLELTPGVTVAKSVFANQGQFSVNGQRTSSNYFSVDGVSANTGVSSGIGLGQSAAGTLPAVSILGGLNALVSEDALQEFRVQTSSFAPEYGRTPGAQISIATRSGTNDFHGAAFDYVRNDKLNANDWFANSRGLPRPIERHNDFGGVIGGPIFLPLFGEGGRPWYNGRNRTFFFFSYEGVRLLQPQTRVGSTVPSLAARQTASPALQPYLNAFPLPNGAVLANGSAELSSTYSNPANMDSTSLRIDHSLKRTTLFFRFADAPSSAVVRGGSSSTLSNIVFNALNTRSFTGGVSSNISSVLTNDFRANWTTSTGSADFKLDDFGGARVPSDALLFPSYGTPDDTLFAFIVGAPLMTFFAGRNVSNQQRQVNLIDTVSVIKGAHSFKFGVDVRLLQPVSGARSHDVLAQFSGGVGNPANAIHPSGTVLSGITSTGSTVTRLNPFGLRYFNFSSFFQDTWRTTPKLTLTYGARYDVGPPPKGTDGKILLAIVNADNLANLAFAPAGTPLWDTAYGNIGPRVGLAYSIRGNSSSVLMFRMGAGVFYDLAPNVSGQATSFAPNSSTKSLPATSFPYSSQTLVPPVLPPNPPFTSVLADPDLKTARTYQWNVALEQGLGPSRALSATYVGAKGSKLARGETSFNPNAAFSQAIITRSDASSDYHALQMQFRGRFSSYLRMIASYTWSHSIDTVSNDTGGTSTGGGTPATRLDPNLNRGSSDFDVRHLFTSAFTFSVPKIRARFWSAILGDWSVDAILRARSAFPVDVTISRNIGFGSYAFRPDIITGQAIYVNDPTAGGGRRIDNTRPPGVPNQVGPFLIPTTMRQGNLGRNVIRGFGMYQADIDIRRDFSLTEKIRLQLKAEFFNVTNHPNFGDPAGSIGSASTTGVPTLSTTFGRSSSMLGNSLGTGGTNGGLSPLYQAGGPRSIQFAMKLIF